MSLFEPAILQEASHDHVDCALELPSQGFPQSTISPSSITGVCSFPIENELDIEKDFNSMEDRNQNILDEDDTSKPKKVVYTCTVLCTGMEFSSLEEFERCYYSYALFEGFKVRIKKTLKFDHSDEIRYRQYVCSCAGFSEEKKPNCEVDVDQEKTSRRTLSRRSGCPVNIKISKTKTVWKVRSMNNQHNHLLVSPNSRVYLKQPEGMPAVPKNLVEKFSKSDLPIGKIPDILGGDVGINISQRYCWNHRRDLRRKNLDRGDADAVLRYCREKQAQDPNFFYSIQTDDDDRMVNFFWIDSTAQQYYERFGDVVFDTTYKTNKYDLPLANFVGANNHCQSIMFGFALLQNEQEETFVWLFQTWLQALHGKLPVSILTDQDRAITNAIEKVLPSTTHRFCLWHILKKFPEKYGSLYKKNSPFNRELMNCLYHTVTVEQFDNEWKVVLDKYKLGDDEWLNHLFDIRQSWVLVYNRTIFLCRNEYNPKM